MSDTNLAAFETRIKAAFQDAITLARKLKPLGETTEVANRYGREGGKIMWQAGFTEEEANEYLFRIWLMIREEHQS